MDWLIVAGFTLAGLLTRLYGTGSFPLFDGEVISYFRALNNDIYIQFPGTDLLNILFVKVFGDTAFIVRLPMALFGAFSLPLFYGVTLRLYDRFTSVCGTLMLLFSYYHLDNSQLSRYYAAIFFFGYLAFYFYLRFFETFAKKTLLWALLATLAGAFFHPTFLAVPVSILVFSLLVLLVPGFRNREFPRRSAKLLSLVLALCGLTAVVVLFPLIRHWFFRSQSVEGGWGYGCFKLSLQTAKYFGFPLCILAAAGLLELLRREAFRGAFCCTLIITPLLCLLVGSFFVDVRPDYVFYIYPVFFLASARFIAQLRENSRSRIGYLSVMLILLAAMLPEFVSNYTGKQSLDVRTAVSHVKAHYQAGDKICSLLNGFNLYIGPDYPIEPYLGTWYHSGWEEKFKKYEDDSHRLWIVYMDSRDGVAPSFKNWLNRHARLVLEVPEKRFDYSYKCIRVYLKDDAGRKPQPPDSPGK